MPLWVWKDRNFSLLMGTFCLGFAGFSSVTFWLSLYLQDIKHRTALEITVRLLPMVISGVLVNVVCGLILHRVSNKLLTGIGALAYTASFLILSFMNAETTYWAFIFPALILVVVGADIQFNVTNMYVMSSLPPSQQSIAGGIFNTVNKLCNNLGLGISTSVFNSVRAQMTTESRPIRPYLSVYWFAAAAAGLSLFLVPFLTLGMQGGDPVSKTSTSSAEGSENGEVEQAEKGAGDESAKKDPAPAPVDGESYPNTDTEPLGEQEKK
jgi:MFS family permease